MGAVLAVFPRLPDAHKVLAWENSSSSAAGGLRQLGRKTGVKTKDCSQIVPQNNRAAFSHRLQQ